MLSSAQRFFSSAAEAAQVKVNNKIYNLPKLKQPVVGICLDGTAQEYIDCALEAGVMPSWKRLKDEKTYSYGIAETAYPTFTNPNNVSIMTGQPPSKTGICGNYYLNRETKEEVMMNTSDLIRCDSIFAKLAEAGTQVTVVTAKDKLRAMLSFQCPPNHLGSHIRNMPTGKLAIFSDTPPKEFEKSQVDLSSLTDQVRCFSVEALNNNVHKDLTEPYTQLVGRPAPSIYEHDNSIYALELGLCLLREDIRTGLQTIPQLFYLSTTDYVQHKFAPGAPEANAFFAEIDRIIGGFHDLGAIIGVTADHGMNDKASHVDGSPNVVYLEQALHEAGLTDAKVILPITDPYMAHHGALGGYATVYLADKPNQMQQALSVLQKIPGVEGVFPSYQAAAAFDLPADRIGDIVVWGDRVTTLGRTKEWHDLSGLSDARLRSHGSVYEAQVPFFVNRQLTGDFKVRLEHVEQLKILGLSGVKNYDLFDYLLNGIKE